MNRNNNTRNPHRLGGLAAARTILYVCIMLSYELLLTGSALYELMQTGHSFMTQY